MTTGPFQPDPLQTRGPGAPGPLPQPRKARAASSPEHTRTLLDEGHATGGLTDPNATGHGTGHGTRSGRNGGLRLVRTELSPEMSSRYSKPVRARLASEVSTENRRAAGLSDRDVRNIMAQRVAENIEGGRAGILVPERRRALVATAQRLGIRPFDANLIIAVVQDRFRRGLLGQSAAGQDERLEMIAQPADAGSPLVHPALAERRRERFWLTVRLLLASAAIAGILMVWLVNWLTGRLP
ncbi:MAG: hypothetical protein ACKVZJ_05855 [Phycisphaerales bacterium]